jgi:glycosyltransferase involved in cell wall biosynthesis
MFAALLEEFMTQANKYDGQCEILWESDNGERTTGEKRNSLLSKATGEYVAFFDDDDWPSPIYVSSILSAIKTRPDCCSLLGEITTDGANPELFEHSIKYPEWRTNTDSVIRYERNPNHLNPIKASIAKQIKFQHINYGEDRVWSEELCKSGLLKTESKIENVIYYYRYVTRK